MRVLVAHNLYRSGQPSGENVVVADEVQLLRATGLDVMEMLESSDRIDLRSPVGLARTASGPVYAGPGVRRFTESLERHRPDVVHLHNVFPLISPWVVRRAHSAGVPVVLTVHNFRLDCANGTYFRDGQVCIQCAGTRLAVPAVRHGCYRDSRLQSLPMVASRAVHRGTWRSVDSFIALTSFHAAFLAGIGIDADRIVLRPTSAPDPGQPPAPGRDVLFVGRLDDGKGIDTLLDAWAESTVTTGRRLRIVGSGPLLPAVRARAVEIGSVDVLGLLDSAEVASAFAAAGVVAVPSRLFEGFPRVVAESFAHGRPVMVTDHGGLAAIVDDEVGWRVAGGASAWARALDSLTDDQVVRRGAAARARYLAELTPGRSAASLIDVYRRLCARRPDQAEPTASTRL